MPHELTEPVVHVGRRALSDEEDRLLKRQNDAFLVISRRLQREEGLSAEEADDETDDVRGCYLAALDRGDSELLAMLLRENPELREAVEAHPQKAREEAIRYLEGRDDAYGRRRAGVLRQQGWARVTIASPTIVALAYRRERRREPRRRRVASSPRRARSPGREPEPGDDPADLETDADPVSPGRSA